MSLRIANLPIFAVVLMLALAGCAAGQSMVPTESSASGDESITNNQEAGVDEGGIVKAWGDYLVVLRRGRLFTVRVGDRDLAPVCMVDAYPQGSDMGTWYDELLLSESAVVVVGYSYRVGATELGLFELTEDGCIRHRETYFLRSNDYYSSRNYASRVVDGRLVFYMPHVIDDYDVQNENVTVNSALPTFARFDGDDDYDWDEIIQQSEIRLPMDPTSTPTLHTVVTCDLDPGRIGCHAQGIIGGFGRTFYVSRGAVYVWVSDGVAPNQANDPTSVVYRLPLDGAPMTAVRAWGAPVDQFSFSERDGVLNVVVRAYSGGDWMWSPEVSYGDVALARIPLTSFTLNGGTLKPSAYTQLPSDDDGWEFRNRFVGDYLLYGSLDYYYGDSGRLYIHPINGGRTEHFALAHGIERIEAMGENAVVIGPSSGGLGFSSVRLGRRLSLVDSFVLADAYQGEQRSHGFFFRSEGDERGVIGLPIQLEGYRHRYLWGTSTAVLYLGVDRLRFYQLGSLASSEQRMDDGCVVSCVDWYGNSRPIFYRERMFALMGYELVEGVIRNQRIVEVARVDILRDLPRS